ncbi:hypothetical protein [Acinetobacter silvestris]|uniref:Iron-containing redox enzyme family protein n=1 Tax=Acinetobacter silvestris TaxID=1977882 RepID=A0A1Y3CKD6_9GAMM|nr:hypothetical protein [Acinetobacter silvestris]OTG66613.1 hypothetical protein B9T28_05030 [Acinetobacter silvestris]
MNKLSFTQSESARSESLNFIKDSIPKILWDKNTQDIQILKNLASQHPLFSSSILMRLNTQQLKLEQLKEIHINYFNAIVKIFTDALSMLIYQAHQLENHKNIFPAKQFHAKIYARYLLSLNLIDELGFNTHHLELSSPAKSHLVYFLNLLQQLNVNPENQENIAQEAFDIQNFIKKNLNSYANLLLILAITELQVIKYSEALRRNLEKFSPEYTQGYYDCHGIVEDSETLANDDNHEDDIWALFTQIFETEKYHQYEALLNQYLQLWKNFWNQQNNLAL